MDAQRRVPGGFGGETGGRKTRREGPGRFEGLKQESGVRYECCGGS